MDAGRSFALNELESHFISPTTKLLIAQHHQLNYWIPTAIRQLIARPPSLFKPSEYQALGVHNLFVLEWVQTQIQHYRLCIAFHAPSVLHSDEHCNEKEACSEAWEAAWWGGFAKHYLHPDMLATPQEAIKELSNAFIPSVTTKCQVGTVEWVVSKGVLEKENEFITSAIADMTNVLT